MAAEARPYSLAALTTALFLWSLFRVRRRRLAGDRRRSDLIAYAFFALLAAESHYAGTAAVAAAGLLALGASLRRDRRAVWLPIAAASTLVGVLLLPWAPIAWRQMHVGLPWAIRSRTVTYWDMALFKAAAVLPAGFDPRGRALPLGLALCAASALAGFPAFRARLKEHGAAIGFTATAAAAAFFAVGVAGAVTRYVTVPAALASIIVGGLGSILYFAGRDSGRTERAFAVGGLAVLSFLVLRDGIRKESDLLANARAGRSRSFIRDLCREGRFQGGDLVIAAPDMLGPTLWYYLPKGVVLRGFVHWSTPAFADFSDYREKWSAPGTVGAALAALERDVRSTGARRIVLVYAVGNDNPLPFRTRTRELRAGVSERFALVSSGVYGAGERIQIDVWDARKPAAAGKTPGP